MIKIVLFGSTGMLGNYVKKVLEPKNNIIVIDRSQFDISKDSWNILEELIRSIQPNIIINCAGVIPQNYSRDNYKDYIRINSIFPNILSTIANKVDTKFIHISTDCVYDGKKGCYSETDIHNETDIYGITKSLGEPDNTTIIRTSIIGEELNNKNSLLEWLKKNKNKSINGYINHRWNGITCLSLANFISYIIDNSLYWTGVRHIYSPRVVTKYELCHIINEIYNLNITINKTGDNNNVVDKSLTSIYYNNYIFDDIYNQIVSLRDYSS